MLDERGITGRIGVVGSGRTFYVLSLFILNIGLARSMGPDGFGAFQQVFMFGAFFTLLTLGIPETVTFFLPRLSAEERPRFLGQTILLMAANGLAVALVLGFGASYFAGAQGNPVIAGNIRIFGVYGAFFVASAFADPVFIIFQRVRYLFVLSFLHGLLFIGITVWRFLGDVPAEAMFTIMAAFAAVKLLLALTFVRRMRPLTGGIAFSGGKGTILLQLSFAIPVALSNAVDILGAWLDKVVVSLYLGKAALGVFYVGAIEIPFVAVLLSSAYSVVTPVLTSMHHRGDSDGFAALVRKTTLFAAKWVWPFWVYLFVSAGWVVPAVFGPEYTASVTTFRIYLLLIPLRIALYGAIVLALGRPRTVLLTACGALLLNLVLNVILVTRMGLVGPAVATVVSTYAQVVALLWVIRRGTGAGIGALVPFRGLLHIGAVSGFAAAVAFLPVLSGFFETDMQVAAFSATVFIMVYLYAGKRTGLLLPLRLGERLERIYHGGKTGSGANHG